MGEKEPLAQWHAKLGESFLSRFCCFKRASHQSPVLFSPAECASLYLLLAKLLYELAVLLAMYDMALAFSQ